jgi:hypothetical protein
MNEQLKHINQSIAVVNKICDLFCPFGQNPHTFIANNSSSIGLTGERKATFWKIKIGMEDLYEKLYVQWDAYQYALLPIFLMLEKKNPNKHLLWLKRKVKNDLLVGIEAVYQGKEIICLTKEEVQLVLGCFEKVSFDYRYQTVPNTIYVCKPKT